MRADRYATSTAAGIVATPASPTSTATQARRLLLRVRATTRCGRNRAADHSGHRDQREDIRDDLEERQRTRPRRRLLEPKCKRLRKPEEQRRGESAERSPVAEDQGSEADETAAAGHVLRKRSHVANGEVRASERGEHSRNDHGRITDAVDGDADGVGGAWMFAERADAQ